MGELFQVKDDKYHRIKGQQIMKNNNIPEPNLKTSKEESGVNLGFEMTERL